MNGIAKVSMAVAAFSGVLCAMALFACAAPWQEEGLACFQIVMLVLFLVSVSLYAVSSGIARSGEAPRKRSMAKALFARGATCLLFLMGIFFLVAGHGYYVRAKERECSKMCCWRVTGTMKTLTGRKAGFATFWALQAWAAGACGIGWHFFPRWRNLRPEGVAG